jgi:Zinc finger, C3HC4 type (RING finger)
MSTSAAATVGSAAVGAVRLIPHPVYNENDPITEVFVCPLCCDLAFKDPSITHCGHIFCRDCIATALNRQAVCPIDRGSLRMSQVSPISGPLKQVWQSIKVKCPKCTVWSGPLETYESHVKSCQQWDEEQIKTLQDEVASANRVNQMLTKDLATVKETLKQKKQSEKEWADVNRMLTQDLATVQETMKQTLKQKKQLEKELADVNRMLTQDLATVQETLKQALKQKKQLEKELADVTAQMKNAKAAHQVSVRSFTKEMVNAKASMINQPTAAAAPPVPPAAAMSSPSSFSPLLAAAYSTLTRLAESSPRETNSSTTPVAAVVAPPLPAVTIMRMNDPVVSLPSPARLFAATGTTTTTTTTTPRDTMATTTTTSSSTIAPPLTGRRVVRARRPTAATGISLPVSSS